MSTLASLCLEKAKNNLGKINARLAVFIPPPTLRGAALKSCTKFFDKAVFESPFSSMVTTQTLYLIALAQKLGIFPPDLVQRPFSYLDGIMATLTPFPLGGVNVAIIPSR